MQKKIPARNSQESKAGGLNPELTRRGAMIELLEDLPFRQNSRPNIEESIWDGLVFITYFRGFRMTAGSSWNSM